jgi:hypothetical protein
VEIFVDCSQGEPDSTETRNLTLEEFTR